MKLEIRHTQGGEIRATSDEKPQIEGYSALFDEKITIRTYFGDFTESIAPGAFARALSEKQDTKALFNHSSDYPLARVGAGTLDLFEDKKGLFMRSDVDPAVSYVSDLLANIRSNLIFGQSFAFTVRAQKWTFAGDDSDEPDHREILEIGNLYDVGPVTYPAYEKTSISVREDGGKLHEEARQAYVLLRKAYPDFEARGLIFNDGITPKDEPIQLNAEQRSFEVRPDLKFNVLSIETSNNVDLLRRKLELEASRVLTDL